MDENVYEIDRSSLSDQVYSYIKTLILGGALKAGERVPEAQIGERFGVSRTPVREAVKRLEQYGLIEVKPRSHAQVVSLPPSEARDVAAVRVALEVLSVSLVAEHGTSKDFDALESIAAECRRYLKMTELGRAFEMDSKFHLEIAKRSANRHLFELMEKLDAKTQLLRLVLHLPVKRLSVFISQHGRIIASMKAHDVEAAKQLMEHHIVDQFEHYLE